MIIYVVTINKIKKIAKLFSTSSKNLFIYWYQFAKKSNTDTHNIYTHSITILEMLHVYH